MILSQLVIQPVIINSCWEINRYFIGVNVNFHRKEEKEEEEGNQERALPHAVLELTYLELYSYLVCPHN